MNQPPADPPAHRSRDEGFRAGATWPYPRLIAHRGAGLRAPENTLAAFRLGAAHGYRMFECDVKLSRDGIAYCLHDHELDRTTNGHGPVAAWDWARLEALDAGSWHSPPFSGEGLLRLDRLCRFLDASDFGVNVEIKPVPGQEVATGQAVGRCLQQRLDEWVSDAVQLAAAGPAYASPESFTAGSSTPGSSTRGLSRRPLLSSFSEQALAASIAMAPGLVHGLLLDDWKSDWRTRVGDLKCGCVVFNHAVLTQDRVRQVREAGLRLMCYTVNDPARVLELLRWGVDAVITDAIDSIDPCRI